MSVVILISTILVIISIFIMVMGFLSDSDEGTMAGVLICVMTVVVGFGFLGTVV